MAFERKIKFAFDKITGEILKADKEFCKTVDAFKIRKQFHNSELELYCCECEQRLYVSTSKFDRLHFKHGPGSNPCLLKDSEFSPEENELIYRIFKSKESDRHKELKHEIGDKISKINGVKNVHIDDKYIIDDKERKRPDVYCEYFDRRIVFEIQLSDLSLRYIISRYEFYKRNKIYLVWILDKFDVHGQSITERDIKYLTEFQNFFKLDEEAEEFKLKCKYKFPFLTKENELRSKWITKSVSLNQIKFSQWHHQIYYFNFSQRQQQKVEEQKQIDLKWEEELRQQEKFEKEAIAITKTERIIENLKSKWISKSHNFEYVKNEIRCLSRDELERLNSLPAFEPKDNEPRIHFWFQIAKREHYYFLDFMLDCHSISLNVNAKSSRNKSLLYTLFENDSIRYKIILARKILKRGYRFNEEDEVLFKKLNLNEKDFQSTIILFHLSNRLPNKSLIDDLFEHGKLFCTIESAKKKEIVGFGWKKDEWIAFANNAIHAYKENWDYIEFAFRYYGIWEKLLSLDKRGTFQKKLMRYYDNKPEQNFENDRLFKFLYPELPLRVH